jgi:hypothetical protein
MRTPPEDAIKERQRLLYVQPSPCPVCVLMICYRWRYGAGDPRAVVLGLPLVRRYGELVESQKKCAKLAARKAAAIKAKAEYEASLAKM